MTISEICRMFGITTPTLRFYEKNFPTLLTPARTTGGHRIYGEPHRRALQQILQLLREKGLTLRQAREALESRPAEPAPAQSDVVQPTPATDPHLLERLLAQVEKLTQSQSRIDQLMETLIGEKESRERRDLLTQISSLRQENQKVAQVITLLMSRSFAAHTPAADISSLQEVLREH